MWDGMSLERVILMSWSMYGIERCLFVGIPPQVLVQSSLPSSIFAGTKISPEALVQTLKFEELPHVALPSKKGENIWCLPTLSDVFFLYGSLKIIQIAFFYTDIDKRTILL